LGLALGLPMPRVEVIVVSDWLIEHTQDLRINLSGFKIPCRSGKQLGSLYVGSERPAMTFDYLPRELLETVVNIGDFARALVLDKWTCNSDGRQAIFWKAPRKQRYAATIKDHQISIPISSHHKYQPGLPLAIKPELFPVGQKMDETLPCYLHIPPKDGFCAYVFPRFWKSRSVEVQRTDKFRRRLLSLSFLSTSSTPFRISLRRCSVSDHDDAGAAWESSSANAVCAYFRARSFCPSLE